MTQSSIIDLPKQLQCLVNKTLRLFGEYLFSNFKATYSVHWFHQCFANLWFHQAPPPLNLQTDQAPPPFLVNSPLAFHEAPPPQKNWTFQ